MAGNVTVPMPPRLQWRVPAYLPSVQPRLTKTAITKAQKRLGLGLPAAYLDALREQNGGYLRHYLPDHLLREVWGIGPEYPSILEGSIAERCGGDGWLPRGASALIPFDGDGHWYMCFDVRRGRAEPAITLVDVELEREERVAASFARLLTMLRPDDRPTVGLDTRLRLATVAARLAKVLRAKVTDQGDQDHGYRSYVGRVRQRSRQILFWVTPNEVSRGFVRKGHPDRAALLAPMPGTALRWPEHADCRVIVSADGLDTSALLVACIRAGLEAKDLSLPAL